MFLAKKDSVMAGRGRENCNLTRQRLAMRNYKGVYIRCTLLTS